MAIGYQNTLITLSSVDGSVNYSFTAGRCVFNGNNVTLLEYGTDAYSILNDIAHHYNNTPFKINGLGQYLYTIGGYSDSDGVYGYIEYIAGNSGINSNNYADRRKYTIRSFKGGGWTPNNMEFQGDGFYFFVDDTTYSKPQYLIGGIARKNVGNGKSAPCFDQITFNYTARASYVVNNTYLMPYYASHVYWTVFRDYNGSDYDKDKAGGIVVNGFPYKNASESTGGQGEMVDTSESISLPPIGAISTGNFLSIYGLTTSQLTTLSNFLLSDSFLDSVKKLYSNPMDYIISLKAMPLTFSGVTVTNMTIGGVKCEMGDLQKVTLPFKEIDFGSIAFNEYYQTFMDYSPYTKVTIYLPYIGFRDINIDPYQGDAIHLKYRVDIYSGKCVAILSTSTNIVDIYEGDMAYTLPIRQRDMDKFLLSSINTITGIASGIATGNPSSALSGLGATITNLKGSISSGGSFGGNSGAMINKRPFLIIQRPSISVPTTYGHDKGFLSQITAKLGDLKGYTKVQDIHLEGLSITADEKDALLSILKEGIVL